MLFARKSPQAIKPVGSGGEGGIRTIEILTKAAQTGGFFVILSEAKNPFLLISGI